MIGTACWEYPGWKNDGYGVAKVNGKSTYTHRAVYVEFHGPIPEGHHVDHTCVNRACFNYSHLEAVTPGENLRRVYERGGR